MMLLQASRRKYALRFATFAILWDSCDDTRVEVAIALYMDQDHFSMYGVEARCYLPILLLRSIF